METRRIEKRCLHEGMWVALALLPLTLSNSNLFTSFGVFLLKQSSAIITPNPRAFTDNER
jgi:hypothetical protein